MSDPDSIIEPIRRAQKWQTRALVLVFTVAIGFAVFSWYTSTKIHDSLCTLREDRVTQVEQTKDFLAHPERLPAFNDPQTLAIIKSQLTQQESTVKALDQLNC